LAKVYVLQHVHSMDDGTEDISSSVYIPHENMLRQRLPASARPCFSEAPAGFHIDEYQLDKDNGMKAIRPWQTRDGPKPKTRRFPHAKTSPCGTVHRSVTG